MKVSKKMARIVTILMIIFFILFSISNVFAVDDIKIPSAKSSDADKAIGSVIGQVISVAQIVGAGVAVIMLIVLAIKYVSAAPNDKAEIKKHAVVYIVGAIVLFAATGLLEIVKKFAGGIKA